MTDATATRTIFSHDSSTNTLSNMIDIVVTTDKALMVKVAHPSATTPDDDNFNGECKTSDDSFT
jgi:hypothetical protein